MHDAERADLEPRGIRHVGAEGGAGRQGDLAHDLGQHRAVAADHGGLADAHPLADDAPTSSLPASHASWLMPSSRLTVMPVAAASGATVVTQRTAGSDDALRRPRRERVDEGRGLLHAALDERTRGVGALPAAARLRLAVPQHDERERAR